MTVYALEPMARRLWPDHLPHAERNREEWKRAVGVVRELRGWLCDQPVERIDAVPEDRRIVQRAT